MSDKELLELAAKAAGLINARYHEAIAWEYDSGTCILHDTDNGRSTHAWNPLTDDGDAMRLAVLLSIDVMHRFVGGRRCEALAPGGKVVEVFYQDGCDFYAPTRRAIVRAAAAIGQSKEGPTP